jgi:hypothetical protein
VERAEFGTGLARGSRQFYTKGGLGKGVGGGIGIMEEREGQGSGVWKDDDKEDKNVRGDGGWVTTRFLCG